VELIIDKLKTELNIQNRINYERPLKKFFNQTRLLELLKGEIYTKSFVGSEAVDYVLQNPLTAIQLNTREDATEFLQVLLNANVFHHVAHLPKFLDELQLYRFVVSVRTMLRFMIRIIILFVCSIWDIVG
jgi:hypothetical protein